MSRLMVSAGGAIPSVCMTEQACAAKSGKQPWGSASASPGRGSPCQVSSRELTAARTMAEACATRFVLDTAVLS